MRRFLSLITLVLALGAMACDDDGEDVPRACAPPAFRVGYSCVCPQGYGVSDASVCVMRPLADAGL